ncbi:MAG: hypothetical protein KGI60_01925 [Patescibacteria group bacterium]|nr:hypothetical protein [Patescibacteria group bacterium]
MKVTFAYDKEKDIWCILHYGKGSRSSQIPTKTYNALIAQYGENPTHQNVADFIEKYASEKGIDFSKIIIENQKEWDRIADEYQKRAEAVFGISLPEDVTAYITLNNRYPYNIEGNSFFAPVDHVSIRGVAMHELWHFYTWYKFGVNHEPKMEKQTYRDIKEALTVLLNTECKDLMTGGIYDEGYPQHKELREKILRLWNKSKNIEKVWEESIS